MSNSSTGAAKLPRDLPRRRGVVMRVTRKKSIKKKKMMMRVTRKKRVTRRKKKRLGVTLCRLILYHLRRAVTVRVKTISIPCANSVLIALDVRHTSQMLRTRSCAATLIARTKVSFAWFPGAKEAVVTVVDSVKCDTDVGYATIISGKWKESGHTAPGNVWRKKEADHR
jgi:hypothetical protein